MYLLLQLFPSFNRFFASCAFCFIWSIGFRTSWRFAAFHILRTIALSVIGQVILFALDIAPAITPYFIIASILTGVLFSHVVLKYLVQQLVAAALFFSIDAPYAKVQQSVVHFLLGDFDQFTYHHQPMLFLLIYLNLAFIACQISLRFSVLICVLAVIACLKEFMLVFKYLFFNAQDYTVEIRPRETLHH